MENLDTKHRFIVFPGTDGTNDLGFEALCELYGLDPAECLEYQEPPLRSLFEMKDRPILAMQYDHSLRPLHPIAAGDYKGALMRMKVEDYRRYHKQRKLLVHNSQDKRRRHHVPHHERVIAQLERTWPDFRETYDRIEGDRDAR